MSQPNGDNLGTAQEQMTQGLQNYQTQQAPQQDDSNVTGQAPYADYLNKLPETVRPLVEPVFKEWDAGVTQRFQQLQSGAKEYEPYQDIVSQYEPEAIQQAIQIAEAIDNNPQAFVQMLSEAYGLTPDQGQQLVNQVEDDDEGIAYDPRYDKLEENLGTVAQSLLAWQTEQKEQQEEQEIISIIGELQNQYGDFDVDWVLTKAARDGNIEGAVQAYQSVVGQQAQQLTQSNDNAPTVLGSGGGLPTINQDPTKWDKRQTQDTIAAMLHAANQQQN